MTLQQYLSEHTIIQIGYNLPGYLCTDAIVDNPIELLEHMDGNNFLISGIQWWERTRINERSMLGGGGIRDPRCPEEYFFSETMLSNEFNELTNKQDYLDYIQKVISSYPQHELYPSFDIIAMG